jgi:O-antigen/teichoic acid export membrane protein
LKTFETPREPDPAAPSPGRTGGRKRFLVNVAWNWTGVGFAIFVGVFLSPFIIRKLGTERFGIWALMFALTDYLRYCDFGFRAAIINFCARHHATGDADGVNRILSTGSMYFACLAGLIAGAGLLVTPWAPSVFHVNPQYQNDTVWLLALIVAAVALRMSMGVFGAALEAFQRFDLSTRRYVLTIAFRGVGSLAALLAGYGLVTLGLINLASSVLEGAANWAAVRSAFPQLRLRWSLVDFATLKAMARYGSKSVLINASQVLLMQGPPTVIGYHLPTVFVGYYALPFRLLVYAMDAVSQVGNVTASSSAAMHATGKFGRLVTLATYTNRYCLALCLPLTAFLGVYGAELFRVWVGPEYAAHSAPLLPMLMAGVTVAWASQFNATAILIGLGQHGRYAQVTILEGALVAGMSYWVAPRYGIAGVAWVVGGTMVLSRGIAAALLFCHSQKVNVWTYFGAIYLRPALVAVPIAALLLWLKAHGMPGANWTQLIAAGAAAATLWAALGFTVVLAPEHRRAILDKVAALRPAKRG